jgi:hypothetical protein
MVVLEKMSDWSLFWTSVIHPINSYLISFIIILILSPHLPNIPFFFRFSDPFFVGSSHCLSHPALHDHNNIWLKSKILSSLKMEAAHSSESLVSIYQTARRHIPEDSNRLYKLRSPEKACVRRWVKRRAAEWLLASKVSRPPCGSVTVWASRRC